MLDRDGSVVHNSQAKPKPAMKHVYAELPNDPNHDQSGKIGRLLALAFDQLGFRRLELRVTDQDTNQTVR